MWTHRNCCFSRFKLFIVSPLVSLNLHLCCLLLFILNKMHSVYTVTSYVLIMNIPIFKTQAVSLSQQHPHHVYAVDSFIALCMQSDQLLTMNPRYFNFISHSCSKQSHNNSTALVNNDLFFSVEVDFHSILKSVNKYHILLHYIDS